MEKLDNTENLFSEFDEIVDTPAGGLYIKLNKKEFYYIKDVFKFEKKENILKSLVDESNGGLILKIYRYNARDLYNVFSSEKWMEVLEHCKSNCKKNSLIRLLDKYVVPSCPPYLREEYTPKDIFNTIKDCLCPICGPKIDMVTHYMELLDTESLIRQGYLNEFLNSFIEYKNFGTAGREMYGKYNMSNIRTYMSNHDLEVTKISGGIFSLDNFYEWLHQSKIKYFYKDDPQGLVSVLKQWTTPVSYSAPDGSGGRIEYKLPNLFSYANSALYIDDMRDKIIDYFVDNRNSLSKFLEYDDYLKDEIKATLLIGKSRRFTLQIQDFPQSVYTHSIEWIMGGKLEAKKNLGKRNSSDNKSGQVSNLTFGKDLDTLMSIAQNGETHGIPVGTLVSSVVAEIYMCKFDEELLSEGNLSFSREFNKITFGYDTDYELMEIKRIVYALSNKYSLGLSEVPVECDSFPFVETGYKSILNYFDSSPLGYEVDIESRNIKNIELSIRRKIYQFIDHCVSEEGRGVEGSLETMIPALVSTIRDGSVSSLMNRLFNTDKEKFKFLQRIFVEPNYVTDLSIFEKLLDVCLLHPRITQKYIDFSQFMVNLATNSSSQDLELEKAIGENVAKYFSKAFKNLENRISYILDQGYSQELHSLLNLFIVFDYDKNYMSKYEVKNICKSIISSGIDDINMILATMIYYRKFGNFDDILEDAAKILWRSHYIVCDESDGEYVEDKNWYRKLCSCGKEFSGELWMYRYFMYSLNSKTMFLDEWVEEKCREERKAYEARRDYLPYLNSNNYEYYENDEDYEDYKEYIGYMRYQSYLSGENEIGNMRIYYSFRDSLNRVRVKNKIALGKHFKFRLTKRDVDKRLTSRGMIIHKFYREMLDAGVRIVAKGNPDYESGSYGFIYGLTK